MSMLSCKCFLFFFSIQMLQNNNNVVNNVVDGYYLPGVKMETFQKDTLIPMFVNSLTSVDTLLPIDYYKLPFCKPTEIESQSENLGEYLTANRIQNSPYQLTFLNNVTCAVVCQKTYSRRLSRRFAKMIASNYRVHWILDNLPVATETMDGTHELGFPLGVYQRDLDKKPKLNNHVQIRIGYHVPTDQLSDGGGRIVDFAVFPYSHDYTNEKPTDKGAMPRCGSDGNTLPPVHLEVKRPTNMNGKMPTQVVQWTYSVEWVEMKDREWRTRWDVYFELGSGSDTVHWFSIINALLIVLFLSGMVGMILMRSLHRDINRYNAVPSEEEREEEREETGWKLVHADVFRPPTKLPMIFCVCIGTGAQIFAMSLFTLAFAAIGFLSPSNRGNLMVALLVLFVLMGILAGYFSSRTYKMFKGKRWQLCTTLTATFFPGIMFTVFFMLNLFAWAAGSDAAVPFGSMILVVLLWFGVSVPLVFAGAWIGYRKPAIEFPVATSNIPRPIPVSEWYMGIEAQALMGGVLPFGAIFVELYFVLTSIWTDKYYYVFGFLLLAFFILLGTCCEITMVLTYFSLCVEDYRWWWRSFLVAGSCGFYVFMYSIYYYLTRLDVSNLIGTMLYFGYMSVISGAIALTTGAVGFATTFFFNKKIYGTIKVD